METDHDTQPGILDIDSILVRSLKPEDLDAIVRIDEKIIGRSRKRFYDLKLKDALVPGALKISLAAEDDGVLAGFLLASLYYGEFGLPEPSAVLDTIGVDPAFRGRKVGKALMHQLLMNLRGLGIERVRTEVEWSQLELMGFLAHEGFAPAGRFCLDLDLASRK
jgi:ribosomal protein S18 acetylase RimI-like enzyme